MRLPWASRSPRRVRHKPLVQVPFLGRDPQLTALHEHLQAVREGRGQYVLLAGDHGSGKSALLRTFAILHCTTPDVLALRLHAGDWLVPSEFSLHLFRTLWEQSSSVVQRVYEDTKRLRRMLAVHWDETEFAHILTSTDWAQLAQQSPPAPARRQGRDAPLRQLLAAVRRHPWGVGAATILDLTARQTPLAGSQESWLARWQSLLQALKSRQVANDASLVLLIDQLECLATAEAGGEQDWTEHWQSFAEALRAADFPAMVVWAGTAESLQPVRRALQETVPVMSYTLRALDDDDTEQLLPRVQKRLPRARHDTWQQLYAGLPGSRRSPGLLLLAATWTASAAPGEPARRAALPDAITMVHELVELIAQRHPEQRELLLQLLEACAFLPSDKPMSVDDLFLLCDPGALHLAPVSGRMALETLLGECVRYGLVHHDGYSSQYYTAHQVIQEAMQRFVCPEATERQSIARHRQVAAAILRHVRSGRHDMLQELANWETTPFSEDASTSLAPYVLRPLERLLAQSSKAERQCIAGALGGFRSPLAVSVLASMLRDSEGQVRSRAVQSLADLEDPHTCAALLTACQDPDSDVRWIAAHALGKIDDTTTIDALIARLTDDDKEVGRIAAEGLGAKGDRRAVPHLIAALNDNYPLLRESAALALGELADQRAFPALQALLQDDNRQVRRSAAKALERFGQSMQ